MVFQAKKGTHTKTFTSVNSYLEICFQDWSAHESYAGKIVELKDGKKEMLKVFMDKKILKKNYLQTSIW